MQVCLWTGTEKKVYLPLVALVRTRPRPSAMGTFGEADARTLCETGFCVVDGFLDPEVSERLRLEGLAQKSSFRPHKWVFAGAKLPKPGIAELDMLDERAAALAPVFSSFWRQAVPAIIDGMARVLDGVHFPHRIAADHSFLSLKVQHNAGRGACFPLHHDNPGPPSRRVLTIVVYLNREWTPTAGGELVLWPFAQQPQSIAPIFNRAVVFRSDVMLHGVQPAHRDRLCFTIWVDAESANRPEDVNLLASHLSAGRHHDGTAAAMAAFFRTSPLQRSIVRTVYAPEMLASLRACLTAADGVDEATVRAVLAAHNHAASRQRSAPALAAFFDVLSQAIPPASLPLRAPAESCEEPCGSG